MSDLLFTPTVLGRLDLPNRVVMAPMTRSRAIGNVPNALIATYYAQRAEAGLIVTEGVAPSPDGLGYARIPGVYSDTQVAGWRTVTDAVHAAGGRIVVQLMHTGRVAHPLNLPVGARVVGPSAIAAPGTMWTDQQQLQPLPVPHALTDAEVEAVIDDFVLAAGRAVDEAGFDGVELHGANGYLIEQFLDPASNTRDDRWGGTPERRARFAVEVARRVADRIGADRLGIRLSPYGAAGGMTSDETTPALYAHLATELGRLGLAYVHVVDHSALGAPPVPDAVKATIRERFGGPIVLSGGYDADRASSDLAAGKGEVVAFGRPFISNPRLVMKLREGRPLLPADPATFYAAGPEGYIDYPLDA